jgi:small subunit ribosomal protein S17
MSAEDPDKPEVEDEAPQNGVPGDAEPALAAEEPAAVEEPAAAEEPAAVEEPAAEAGESPADDEQPAPAGEEAADAAQPTEPEAALTHKEARRRARSTHTGPAGEPRDAQQRQAERDARRRERAGRRSACRKNARARAAKRREAEPAQPPLEPIRQGPGRPKSRQGVVVSDRPDKTIVVRVDLTRRHRRYGKTVRASSTLHAHDEANDARAGDTVRILESRPMSKTKRWRLVEVVERAR